MRTVSVALAAAALAFVAVPVAGAIAPPSRSYDCTIGGSTLFGTIKILAGARYTYDGKQGSFTAGPTSVKFSDKIVGWTLKFKGGGLAGFNGRWYWAKGGPSRGRVPEIALKNPRDGFEFIYCDV